MGLPEVVEPLFAEAKKPRITASWAAVLIIVLANVLSAWSAVIVHGMNTTHQLAANKEAIELTRAADQAAAAHLDSTLNDLQAVLRQMHATDSTLNERQLINTFSVRAIVAGLRARGIVITAPSFDGSPQP